METKEITEEIEKYVLDAIQSSSVMETQKIEDCVSKALTLITTLVYSDLKNERDRIWAFHFIREELKDQIEISKCSTTSKEYES